MDFRNRSLVTSLVVVIAVVGFFLGALIAHNRNPDTTAVTVARETGMPLPVPTPVPNVVKTKLPRPTNAPATRAPATPAPEPPVPTRTPLPIVVPAVATLAPVTAPAAARGAWQVDEANLRVGTIVWSGSARVSGGSIEMNLRKVSVAGQAATACERATVLRATIAIGTSPQTVPYQEVNCAGGASSGEVHVDRFAGQRAFSGSFSQGGVNLGTFDARAL